MSNFVGGASRAASGACGLTRTEDQESPMHSRTHRRLAVCLALLCGLTPFLWAFAGSDLKVGDKQEFKGKVVPLASILKKAGSTLDPDAAKHWVALVAEDGQIYPLIKEDRSRMFFQEPKTQDRPMIITGRLIGATHLLQVLDVKSVRDNKLHEIFYWCDICAIRRNSGGVCECCGGLMELRELPLKK
jgi:hypothetical protein